VNGLSEWELLVRILVAGGLSAFIGFERERHGRPAGLRTHILVAIGAALVLVLGEAFTSYRDLTPGIDAILRIDPGRLAAGVITGIGFLGAGTIIRTGDWVRGLTTAASLWFVAAVGLVAGAGYFILAAGGTAIGFAVLSGLDMIENRIHSTVYRDLIIEVAPEDEGSLLDEIRAIETDRRIRCTLTGWEQSDAEDRTILRFIFRYRGAIALSDIGTRLSMVPGVVNVRFE
jgi:putative Mg2+ transporter-C (MgtC) family protein